MAEELSRQSLYQYLNYVKLAVRVANEKLDLENLDQEQREQLACARARPCWRRSSSPATGWRRNPRTIECGV